MICLSLIEFSTNKELEEKMNCAKGNMKRPGKRNYFSLLEKEKEEKEKGRIPKVPEDLQNL